MALPHRAKGSYARELIGRPMIAQFLQWRKEPAMLFPVPIQPTTPPRYWSRSTIRGTFIFDDAQVHALPSLPCVPEPTGDRRASEEPVIPSVASVASCSNRQFGCAPFMSNQRETALLTFSDVIAKNYLRNQQCDLPRAMVLQLCWGYDGILRKAVWRRGQRMAADRTPGARDLQSIHVPWLPG